jgi:hypothetical protein
MRAQKGAWYVHTCCLCVFVYQIQVKKGFRFALLMIEHCALSTVIINVCQWVPAVNRLSVQIFKFRLQNYLFGTNLETIWKDLS